MTSGIYTITNIINNKLYVGHTTNFKKRFSKHLNTLRRDIHANSHLQNSWNKYGESNFKFEILENCEEKFLYSVENYWCNLLNVLDTRYGYNKKETSPTGNKTKLTKEAIEKIKTTLKGRKLSNEAYKNLLLTVKQRSGKNHYNCKKVFQYSLEGNFIRKYDYITEITEYGYNNKLISKVLSGKGKSACGFIWTTTYLGPQIEAYCKKERGKEIGQYTINNVLITKYKTLNQASIESHTNKTSICGVMSGKNKTANGFKWKYIN